MKRYACSFYDPMFDMRFLVCVSLTYGRCVNVCVCLNESSAHLAESASSGGDAMETLVDLERVRIKMELARVRATGGPVHGVPSGRVFDAPPGGGEATDGKPATAEVQTAMERIRSVASDAEDDEPLIKKKSSKVLTVKKLELPEKTKRGVKMSPRESDAIVPTPTGAKVRFAPVPVCLVAYRLHIEK